MPLRCAKFAGEVAQDLVPRSHQALELAQLQPDVICYSGVISACAKGGAVALAVPLGHGWESNVTHASDFMGPQEIVVRGWVNLS